MTDMITRSQGRIQKKSFLKHPFYQDWQAEAN